MVEDTRVGLKLTIVTYVKKRLVLLDTENIDAFQWLVCHMLLW